MIEPISLLATWGLTTTAKFVYSSVLEELNKDSTKKWVKDLLEDWFKDVAKEKLSGVSGSVWEKATKYLSRDSLDIAAETAITAFLVLINKHLAEDLGLSEEKRERFQKPLNSFLKDEAVRQILGSPFQQKCDRLDIKALKEIWDDKGLRDLPDDFNWDKLGKDYREIVKKVFNESAELKPLLDFQRAEKDSQNLQNIAGVNPEFDLDKYRETILEKYGNLKLESLDSSGYIYDKELKIYQVFIPQKVKECQEYLPQVYELPKELQRKLKEQGEIKPEINPEELERYKKAYSNQQIRSVLEVIADDQYKYLVILGDPGSGKSTLLQYLAVEWAKLPSRESPSYPLTILIELQKYIQDFREKRCNNFLEYIHQGSTWICHLNQNELDEYLRHQPATILFDGLDEVFDPILRANIIAQIHSFTQKPYPQLKVIVTSRIIGYKPKQLKDAEFHHFMLQDLEPDQIEDFLERWHDLTYNAATENQKKQDRQKRITKAVKDSPAIQQLAGNPLLLTMMAILNRNQDLPRDRAKLYERSSELLLYQWDVEAKLLEDPELKAIDIDYSDKQAMLREVANFMQATDKGLAGNLISHQDLKQILIDYLQTIDVNPARKVARLMIEQLRARNFILCDVGGDYYAFVHRTFLEYFCAWSYIYQLEAQALSVEQIKTEVFGNHWQDESWHEVLRLIAGMILDPLKVGEIIEYLMDQDGETANFNNLFLAADCLSELRNRKSITTIADRLLDKLKQFAQQVYEFIEQSDKRDLNEKLSAKVINAIANNWKSNPNTLPWLKTCLKFNSNSYVPESAVSVIAKGWKDYPDTLPWLQQCAQSDDHYNVRRTAVQELIKGWKKHPNTLPIIQQRAQSDDFYDVRITAVQELTQGWKEHHDTLPIIQQRAQSDDDYDVRSTAVQELIKGWKEHPDTLPIIQQRAQSDDDSDVRSTAIQELAKGWKEHPDTLSIIQQRAQSDDNEYVRSTAVQELAQGWKEHLDTLPIIQQRAKSDDNEYVRSTAVQELAKGWKEHPDTLSIIQQQAQSDDNEYVRSTAVQELAQGWKEHPDTLSIIQQYAQSDDNEYVRITAVQELAQGWKEHPDTLPIIQQRAQSDDNYRVRLTAVQELAKGWKEHPDTLPIIQQRAQSDDDNDVRITAVQELAKGWKEHPDTFRLLVNCAVNDPFVRGEGEFAKYKTNPRQTALQEIVKHFPNHPQTKDLLIDRINNDPDEQVREFAQQALDDL